MSLVTSAATCSSNGLHPQPGQLEADLMIERARGREVIEIKLTSGPTPEDLARLAKVGEMIQATRLVLLCRVRKSVATGRQWVTNLSDLQASDEGMTCWREDRTGFQPLLCSRFATWGVAPGWFQNAPLALQYCGWIPPRSASEASAG